MYHRTVSYCDHSVVLPLSIIVMSIGSSVFAQEYNVVVDAKANIFAAGLNSPFGGGVLPVQIDLPTESAIDWIVVPVVTGQIKNGPASEWFGPDGKPDNPRSVQPFGGLSGTNVPQGFPLMGVFLTDVPADPPAPLTIDFNKVGIDFLTLAPALHQIFFIGDGLTGTGTGTIQKFAVPPGATRLFLGIPDACNEGGSPGCYSDNSGSFNASVRIVNIADLNCDGVVGVPDLLLLLAAWGPCAPSGDCPADLNGDGTVGVSDLLILLANWG